MEAKYFERGKCLGEGAFGKVFLCFHKKEPGKKYAMKVIDLKYSSEDERYLAEKEAILLTTLKHQFILHAVSVFQDRATLCIVTELCNQGDLETFLNRRKGHSLDEQRIVEWFRQICSALEYLHGRNILHRDIKTQNIFLTGNEMTIKLGDLGLAKVLESSMQKALTNCGTPYYMSPEIHACKPYNSKSDIWAMGVCVYEMTTLKRPFDARSMHQLIFKIIHGQLPPMPKDEYSPRLIKVIERMLCRDADSRPSATELLQDVLFKKQQTSKQSAADVVSHREFGNPYFQRMDQGAVAYPIKRESETRTDDCFNEELPNENHNYEYFWEINSAFSQWFPCKFVVNGMTYNSAVQYMMHQKAVLMGDEMSAETIMALDEPQKMKKQGRFVKNFNQELWNDVRQEIVETGNVAKFSQNEGLKTKLFNTFPKTLVEASPTSKIWGIGLSMDDKRAWNKLTWRGQNLLGEILTRVRDKLMRSFLEPVVPVTPQ